MTYERNEGPQENVRLSPKPIFDPMRKYIFAFVLVLLIAACKKEKYICEYSILYIRHLGVAFAGFSQPELDTIILSSYAGNTGLTTLIKTDTLLISSAVFANDTAYASGPQGFWTLKSGVDYRATVLSTGHVFTVTGAGEGPSFHRWTQETSCSPGAGQPRITTPINVHINGQPVQPYTYSWSNFFIVLKK